MPFLYDFKLNGTKLDGVEIGFSHSRKWEEALDEAKFSLPFYTSESPISQYGLLEITIYEVDNYTDLTELATETINMLVISDKVSVTSQYGIWRHDISLIEYTAKLDAYIMASLARTRDLVNENRAKFEITTEGLSLINGAGTGAELSFVTPVWIPPIDIKQTYYANTNYTLSQVEQAYQATTKVADIGTQSELMEYTRRPVVYRITNIDTSTTGSWITLSSSDQTLNFDTVGNYYIEYGINATTFPVSLGLSSGYYSIFKFYVRVISENSQTVWDALMSVRRNVSKYGGIESIYYYDDTRIFDIDSTYETYLKSIQIPQMYLESATARQMLVFILSYINALPRLEYGEDLDILTIEQFNLSTGTYTEENTFEKSGSQNVNQIGTRSYSTLKQVLPNNMDEATTYAPSQDGLIQVRASNLQVTDSTFGIKLEKEIYTPKEFTIRVDEISFDNTDVPGFSISSYEDIDIPLIERLVNIEEWKLKDVTDNFPTTTTKEFWDSDVGLRQNMVENLYWELNAKKIEISDVYGTVVQQTLLRNVVKLAIYEYIMINMPKPYTYDYLGTDVMVYGPVYITIDLDYITDASAYKDLRFNFSYLTIENLVTKQDKEDLTQIDFYSEMRQNQDESIINVVRSSRKQYGNLQRTGNKVFSFQKVHFSLADAYDIGVKDVNDYTITQIDRQFYGRYFLADYFVTKYHNRESRQMIVDQTYRWRDNYANAVLNRHENYSDYIVIYPPGYNYNVEQHTKIYNETLLYPKLFGLILGDDASDLETRASVAMIRTDGMFEVEEETPTSWYGIVTPVSAYPLKNGLAFTFGFDSNQVAGDGLVQRGSYWYNQAVRYTNEQARFNYLGFEIMPKFDFNESDNDYEHYPKIQKTSRELLIGNKTRYFTTGSFNYNEVGSDALVVDKDALTNFNLTYQLAFSSFYNEQYIFGQAFFNYNWLVNNPNQATTTAYLYLYSDSTKYGLFEDLDIKSGYDSETLLTTSNCQLSNGIYSFIGSISLTGVTSWAIGTENGELLIACNEGLNGFEINPEHYLLLVKEIGNKTIYYEIPSAALNETASFAIDVDFSVVARMFRNHVDVGITIDTNISTTGYKVNKVYEDAKLDTIITSVAVQGHIYREYHESVSFMIESDVETSGYRLIEYHEDVAFTIMSDTTAESEKLEYEWVVTTESVYNAASTKYQAYFDTTAIAPTNPNSYNLGDAYVTVIYNLEQIDLATFNLAGNKGYLTASVASPTAEQVEDYLYNDYRYTYWEQFNGDDGYANLLTDNTAFRATYGASTYTYWRADYIKVFYVIQRA